jgi:hypothetical protein
MSSYYTGFKTKPFVISCIGLLEMFSSCNLYLLPKKEELKGLFSPCVSRCLCLSCFIDREGNCRVPPVCRKQETRLATVTFIVLYPFSIYLSLYLSIYLSIYLWLYSPLLDLGRFFSFLIFLHSQ